METSPFYVTIFKALDEKGETTVHQKQNNKSSWKGGEWIWAM